MRILYDSKQLQHKTPFGTLTPGQECTITIHIPAAVQTTSVRCVINNEDGSHAMNVELGLKAKEGPYEIFQGKFSFNRTGLFFYYFYISIRKNFKD